MTATPSIAAHPNERAPSRVTALGAICLAAGVLGAASGLYLVFAPEQVGDDRFSYPLAAGPFVVLQLASFVQHLGLLAGQVGAQLTGALGIGRAARWGHRLGVAGMLGLGITELLAITARNSPYPSDRTDVLDALYGVTTVAIGIGLVMAGTAVVRERVWTGWARWLPLVLGIWVFVPMTPAIMAGYLPARLGITGWMVLYAALGWALTRHHPEAPTRERDAGASVRARRA